MKELTPEVRKDYILILVASLTFHVYSMMVTAVIAGYSQSLGAQATVMGIIGGLMSLCSLICRPIMGNVTDLVQKKTFATFSFSLIVLAGIINSIAPVYQWVIFARVINGIGFAGCSISLTTWIADILPEKNISSGVGMYGTINALAMAVGPSLGIEIYKSCGYRATFICSTIISAVGLFLLCFVKNRGVPKHGEVTKARNINLLDIRVIPIALIMVLFTIPYSATQSFLVKYIETRNINISASLYFLFYALSVLVLRTTFKKHYDKVSMKNAVPVCVFSAMCSLVLLNSMTSNIMMFFAACFMAGGYGVMFTIAQASAITLVEPGKRGVANSTFYMGFDIGMWLGPTIAGVLYGYLNIRYFYPVFLISIPFIVLVYYFGIIKNKVYK